MELKTMLCPTPARLAALAFILCCPLVVLLDLRAEDAMSAVQDDQSSRASTTSISVTNAILRTIESTRLSAEVAGTLEELKVHEGDAVEAKQAIGKIRDKAIQLQLSAANIAMAVARKKQRDDIDLQLAKKKFEVAQIELERALLANRDVPNTYGVKEVDRLQLVADSTELEVERAKHSIELLELDVMLAENEYRQAEELLERHQVHSPVAGIVVAVNRRLGEWVEPGVEILQIVKIDRLRIEGFVLASQTLRSLNGEAARVTVLTGEGESQVDGKVVFVSPDANPINGQVRVFLEIDNSEQRFRPGMRVKAEIIVESNTAQAFEHAAAEQPSGGG